MEQTAPSDTPDASVASPADRLHDPERLAAVRALIRSDGLPAEGFRRLTRLAATILRAPMTLVSVVDEDRQLFPACVGLPEPWASRGEIPLSYSFCQHVVASGEPLVIDDARAHPLVGRSPAVTELNVVAYAGIPLRSTDGLVLGTFCAVDTRPRQWTEEEIAILTDLTASAMTEVALRQRLREREELTSDLRQGEARVRDLLESTSEGIYGIDREGRCTFVNRAAAEMLGYEPHELLGREMHALIHHTRPDGTPYPREECRIGEAARAGIAVRLSDELLWRRDGTSFPAEYAAAPLLRDGALQGAVVTILDITERKRAEAERERLLLEAQEARERVEDALRIRDEVLGVVAHDLRNPVGTVFTAASFLLEVPLPEDKRQHQLQVIQRAARRADRLIQDLLDVARIESGRLTVAVEPAPVGSLLAELREWAAPQTEAAGLELDVDADPGTRAATVLADRDRVIQLFTNLIGNSVKFTPAGGRVSVRAEVAGGEVRFRVSDTGSGVHPDHLPHLFARFWQASRTDRRGAGLGLAIVKGLVEAHGGQVGAESTPGQGTTVWFTLPLASDRTPGA